MTSDPYIEALVERVARAMARSRDLDPDYAYRDPMTGETTVFWTALTVEARAALSAVLDGIREPSPEMIDAGIPIICRGLPATDTPLDQLCFAPNCECYHKHGLKVTPAAFTAMIDNVRQRNG